MNAPWPKWSTWQRLAAMAATATATAGGGVAIIVALLWPITDLIATYDVGRVTGPLRTLRFQTARNAARGRMLTLGAGLFAAGALMFTALNFTLSRRAFELTEQGQVTDRYTKVIEQFGSGRIDVPIGGIYALGRIARDSARDHPIVMRSWPRVSARAHTRTGGGRSLAHAIRARTTNAGDTRRHSSCTHRHWPPRHHTRQRAAH